VGKKEIVAMGGSRIGGTRRAKRRKKRKKGVKKGRHDIRNHSKGGM